MRSAWCALCISQNEALATFQQPLKSDVIRLFMAEWGAHFLTHNCCPTYSSPFSDSYHVAQIRHREARHLLVLPHWCRWCVHYTLNLTTVHFLCAIIQIHSPFLLYTGPVMVWTVPKIRREYFGYKGIPPLPITYPRMYSVTLVCRVVFVTCVWYHENTS